MYSKTNNWKMKTSRIENSNILTKAQSPNFAQKNNKKSDAAKKIGIAAFSAAGTILPILAIRKYQGKALNKDVFKKLPLAKKGKELWNSLSINYGFKEVMLVCMSSLLGGTVGGLVFDKETPKQEKVKEGIHKAIAQVIPAVAVSACVALGNKAKIKTPVKEIASVVAGIGVGMPVANKVSNALNKKAFKEKDYKERKIKPSDYLMHADDIVSAMVLAKVPFVGALQLDKVLGVIFAHEGYEAGIAKKEKD